MASKFDSNSQFNIYSSFTLSNDDVNVVSLLYAPLMGSDALMLYLGLYSLLERNNLRSEKIKHQDFFDIFSLNTNSFLKARIKLEGIGLLVSYEMPDKNYTYIICPPLTAKGFIKDATLGLYLYAKTSRETFDFIYNHFKVEKIDKSNATNITKTFDEVYQSQVDNEITYDKFKYILGKRTNRNLKIKNYNFDFDFFVKGINLDFLETGITKTFRDQISNLAFVYGFNETEMMGLYSDSINSKGNYEYRLLKNKANTLFNYKRNMKAPKLVNKDDDMVANKDLCDYLNNVTANDLLEAVIPNYPVKYLKTLNDVYAELEFPRGVLNCMVLKVIRDKGELPTLNYFKKMAGSWSENNIFTTEDAIKYVTEAKFEGSSYENTEEDPTAIFGGVEKL